jgi:hypothetical protein
MTEFQNRDVQNDDIISHAHCETFSPNSKWHLSAYGKGRMSAYEYMLRRVVLDLNWRKIIQQCN